MAADGPAADPPVFPQPIIHYAARDEEYLVVDILTGVEKGKQEYLSCNEDPQRAYRRIRTIQPIKRMTNATEVIWGEVNVCVVLERICDPDGIVFAEPSKNNHTLVAVKELRKQVFRKYLAEGGSEDPWKEISAMQSIGDGIHVINCIEALEDEDHLYIVSPYCDGGDLFSAIYEHPNPEASGRSGLPEAHAWQRFHEILECLYYLQQNSVCHGDISVENIMIHNGRCILIDLGCCLRVPVSEEGHRMMIRPQGFFGKDPYTLPEIYLSKCNRRLDFDGFSADLWSVGITLFQMLTGELLESSPIWAVIYSNLNTFIMESPRLAYLTQNMNGTACELINGILQQPTSRFTLEQVMESRWVASPDIHFPMDQ